MTRLHLVHAIAGVLELRDGRRVIATSRDRGALLAEAARLLGGPVSETQDDADTLLTRRVAAHGATLDEIELRDEIARLRGGR